MDYLMERMKLIQDSASIFGPEFGIIISDLNDNIIHINEPAEKIIHYKSSELTGKSLKMVDVNFDTGNIIRNGCSEKDKIFIKKKLYIINKIPFRNEHNEIIGAVIILNDISDLSDEPKKTQQLSQQLDLIFDSIYDAIIIIDGQGMIVRTNKAYQALVGITESDYIGKHVTKLVNDQFVTKSVAEMVIESGEPITTIQQLKSGKELLNSGVPIFDNEGRLINIVTIVRDLNELNNVKNRLLKLAEENKSYKARIKNLSDGFNNDYVIYNKKMQEIFEVVDRVAKFETSVLIYGESGVGKEVVAEYIYRNSNRKDQPFIKVNCGAIPESLIESELFGYEGGSFTGALKSGKKGLLEMAQNGTILFDEVAELSLNMQVKLLRVLQEHEISRVGGSKPISLNVRFLFATNKDLKEMVEKGTFRKDLYYRCNVIVINIPPLRERKDDIEALVMRFIKKFNEKYHVQKRITKDALEVFDNYDWPGNIRELQNIVERLVVSYPKDFIDCDCLDKYGLPYNSVPRKSENTPLNEILEKIEKDLIASAYSSTGCTRKASAVLGINQSTVVKKMKKYGIKSASR